MFCFIVVLQKCSRAKREHKERSCQKRAIRSPCAKRVLCFTHAKSKPHRGQICCLHIYSFLQRKNVIALVLRGSPLIHSCQALDLHNDLGSVKLYEITLPTFHLTWGVRLALGSLFN